MFEAFEKAFSKDVALSVETRGNAPPSRVTGWSKLIDRFGGFSFKRGLYRVIRSSDLAEWNDRVLTAFPEFSGRIACFGFDWLGRVFAVDSNRYEGGLPGVVMFEAGTGEALEVPCNIASFHDEELLEHGDAALASDFHTRWLASGGSAPEHDQCVGYKKPLFLGGSDELTNLELSDVDVYWHIMGQLILKAKGLSPGTSVHVGLS